MDTPNCDHDELLTKCDIHLAYIGNRLFAELRPIKHSVPVPPASELNPGKTTANANMYAPDSGTTLTILMGTTSHDEPPHEVRPRGDGKSAASEPILAGTTSDQVSTKSDFTVNDPAVTSNDHINTLPSTTTESGELSQLLGTTINLESSNVDTSQETMEVIVGSIKSDPTTINMLLSEGRLTPPEMPNLPKDEP